MSSALKNKGITVLHTAKFLKTTHIILLAATFLVQNLQIMVCLITPCCPKGENILLFNFYLILCLSSLLFLKHILSSLIK